MARAFQDVTDAELAVLDVLWERGSATRRQIADVLYPGGGPSHYTTVQKLLERLQAKGHVRKRPRQGVQVFTPTLQREQLIDFRLKEVADKLCGGSVTPLMMHLMKTEALEPSDIDELRALFNKLSRQNKAP